MSRTFYTPPQVARALARHAPKEISRVLEPAVGSGVLLAALLPRINGEAQVDCIDTSATALKEVRSTFNKRLGPRLRTINSDFLIWSDMENGRGRKNTYDCIIMNPPFSARLSNSLKRDVKNELDQAKSYLRTIPVEGLFVLRSVRMLKPGGRLLAILPSSFIAAKRTSWLRSFLFRQGSILYVHELPNFTFGKVEGRVYLLVFEKGKTRSDLRLCNHDLGQPDKIRVTIEKGEEGMRLDYRFHVATALKSELIGRANGIHWMPLSEIAKVMRGSVVSPDESKLAIHSTHYTDGFWDYESDGTEPEDIESQATYKRDILIQRVGRNCALTAGILVNGTGRPCTDCVLIVRPKRTFSRQKVLFALRVILGLMGPELLVRGIGSSYLTQEDLRKTFVPANLDSVYSEEFYKYRAALRRRQFIEMRRIEDDVIKRLYIDSKVG